jgi:hypothetical protein
MRFFFPKVGLDGTLGRGSATNWVDLAAERELASCCGVNLALATWFFCSGELRSCVEEGFPVVPCICCAEANARQRVGEMCVWSSRWLELTRGWQCGGRSVPYQGRSGSESKNPGPANPPATGGCGAPFRPLHSVTGSSGPCYSWCRHLGSVSAEKSEE